MCYSHAFVYAAIYGRRAKGTVGKRTNAAEQRIASERSGRQAARNQSQNLVEEARLSKALRDELDIVRERASKVNRLESELNRYKDKLNDIDYYKTRLEELGEDNDCWKKPKSSWKLESQFGQLESAILRAELVLDLEGELLKCKRQLTNLLVEKEADKERLKKLAEENAHWQLCTNNCLSESNSLTAELESLRAHQALSDKDHNLGEQMSSVDLLGKTRRSKKMEELELQVASLGAENQKLQRSAKLIQV